MGFDVEVDPYEGIDIEAIAKEELYKTALTAKQDYQENLRTGQGASGDHSGSYVDTGEAVNSITISPQREGADEYAVGGDAIQLLIAEYGRAPNNTMPPEEPISDWARRVGLEPQPGQSWDSMIYAIRKSIAENGIEGFAPAQKTAFDNRLVYANRIKVRIDKSLSDSSG